MKKRTFISITICIICLLAVIVANEYSRTSNAAETVKLYDQFDNTTRREMLIDLAEAYQRKGAQYQYDQYRENRYLAPESINDMNKAYSVCSTFVSQVYYNALGINIPILTKNLYLLAEKASASNASSEIKENFYATTINDFIASGSRSEIASKAQKDIVDKIYDYVNPGDIITFIYEQDYDGHTTMVYKKEINNGKKVIKLVHNAGKVYDKDSYEDKYETNGSIVIDQSLIDLVADSYKGKTLQIGVLGIIPKNNKNFYMISKNDTAMTSTYAIKAEQNQIAARAGATRNQYRKMDFKKTYKIINDYCSENVPAYESKSLYVNNNQYIEYTIVIKNNSSSKYSGIKIVEELDKNVTFVSATQKNAYKNGKVVFDNIAVPAGGAISVKYTVKVNDTAKKGTEIKSTGKLYSSYYSNNTDYYIPTKEVIVYVGPTLTEDQKNQIKNNYSKITFTKVTNNNNVDDGKNYIDALYKQLFNIKTSLFTGTNNQTLLNVTYTSNTSGTVNRTTLTDKNGVVMANLYGLKIKCKSTSNNNCDDDSNNNHISPFNAWRYWNPGTTSPTTDSTLLNEYKNRPRTITKDMLETGDVLVINDVAFLYMDGKMIKSGKVIYDEGVDKILRDSIGKKIMIIRPALMEAFPRSPEYKITYRAKEEGVTNLPLPTTYKYTTNNKCVTKLSSQIPERRGYTFAGWQMSTNESLVWQPETNWKRSNAANYTLMATWKPRTYQIVYDSNGGKGAPEPQTYEYAETGVTRLSTVEPTRTGYIFLGWSRDKDAKEAQWAPGINWKLSNATNYTLYAIWQVDDGTEPNKASADDEPYEDKEQKENKDKGKKKKQKSNPVIDNSYENVDIYYEEVNEEEREVTIKSKNGKRIISVGGDFIISDDGMEATKVYKDWDVNEEITIEYEDGEEETIVIKIDQDMFKLQEPRDKATNKKIIITLAAILIGAILIMIAYEKYEDLQG